MAIEYGDGRAGQYAKKSAQKKLECLWAIIVPITAAGSALVGIMVGFMLALEVRRSPVLDRIRPAALIWAAVAAESVIGAAVFFLLRALRRPMNTIMRERVHWLRGGQTEALVALQLRNLSDEWHVFHNVKLGIGADLDHVVVGPQGIFCLSTKSHRGSLTRSLDGACLLNGRPTGDLDEALKLNMKLRYWLEAKLHNPRVDSAVPFVQAVLVVPFAHVGFPARQPPVCVSDDMNLCRYLEGGQSRLNATTVRACVVALQQITGRKPKEAAAGLPGDT